MEQPSSVETSGNDVTNSENEMYHPGPVNWKP